tara:strand:- start:2639 stop:3544 length:906 start_codon:yes stop_codon:yes gene_type:complete
MALTTSTASEILHDVIAPGFVEGVYRQTAPIPLFGTPIGPFGNTSRKWKLNSSGNSSVAVYTEGQPLSGAGVQGWSSASDPYLAVRYEVEATGHAKAALREGARDVDALGEEFILGQKDLVDLVATTIQSGTNGMETAVDATATYATVARGSASWFESAETAVSGLLAVTDGLDLIETMADNDRGSNIANSVWLMPWNQYTNLYNLQGGPANQNIGDADKVPGYLGQTFARIPVVPVPSMTDTVIMLLDLTFGNWEMIEHQPLMVHDQGRSGDADLYLVTYMFKLVCKNPKMQGKLTGVTA